MLSVTFSAEGDRCFSGGADGKIYHWSQYSLTDVVEGHKGPVFALQRVEKVGVAIGVVSLFCNHLLWQNEDEFSVHRAMCLVEKMEPCVYGMNRSRTLSRPTTCSLMPWRVKPD